MRRYPGERCGCGACPCHLEPVREIGRVDQGAVDFPLTVGVDHGTVTVGRPDLFWRLTADQCEDFTRLYFAASFAAEAWAREHAGDEVVEAEIWCGLVDGCIRGPAGSHLFDHSCQTKAEAWAKDHPGPVS